MPALTGSSAPALTDLAEHLATELRAGRPSRAVFGSKDVAFAWTSGVPRTFANFVSTAMAASIKFGVVVNGAGGNPATKVAAKGTKPDVCSLTQTDITLSKYAGMCTYTLEDELSTAGLTQAVAYSIVNKALVAYEKDLAAAIVAGKGQEVTGASSWTAGVLEAVGKIAAVGGRASVLAMAPADFAAALDGTGANLYFDGASPIPAFLGLQVHISPGLTAGTAVVLDGSAVLAVEHEASPVVIADPFHMADTNQIRIVADLVAGFVIAQPESIVTVTKAST